MWPTWSYMLQYSPKDQFWSCIEQMVLVGVATIVILFAAALYLDARKQRQRRRASVARYR